MRIKTTTTKTKPKSKPKKEPPKPKRIEVFLRPKTFERLKLKHLQLKMDGEVMSQSEFIDHLISEALNSAEE